MSESLFTRYRSFSMSFSWPIEHSIFASLPWSAMIDAPAAARISTTPKLSDSTAK